MWFKSSFTIPAVAALCFCLVGGTSPAAADILHVPGDFPTIQAAIDAAVDGDEVEVHPGTYNETINFLGKAIRVYSTDGPDATIIDAQQTGTVVTCNSGEGPDTVLSGFVITGGDALNGGGMRNINSSPTVTNCTFSRNAAGINGAGMYNTDSDLTVTDCTFQGNTAGGTSNNTGGGGMFNEGGNPTVTGCTFDGNTATQSGGAMLNIYASSTVTDCVFTGNIAMGDSSDGGGAIFTDVNPETEVLLVNCDFSENQGFLGGAVCFAAFESDVDPVMLISCSFTNNTATVGDGPGGHGGAVFIFDVGAILIDCVLVANQALQTGETSSKGGGIINGLGGASMLINCTMSGNTASLGGAIHIWGELSSFSLLNSTLSENTALESGGGIWTEGSSGAIANSILWGNSDAGGSDESAQIHLADGDVAVDYSCIEGLRSFPGTGNIDADPLFVDLDNGNFRLMPGSPCIDAGNNWGVPIDENDYDEDGVLCELFPVDLDGNPRFNADEADFDPGCGIPVVVDMGAYEYQFDPADQVTFADLNADGAVGVKDLLILLGNWGPCGKGCCLADLDINGSVGVPDLLVLLGNWGPCP